MYRMSDPLKSIFRKSITLEAGLYAIFGHKSFWTSDSRFVHADLCCVTSKSENFHLSSTTIGNGRVFRGDRLLLPRYAHRCRYRRRRRRRRDIVFCLPAPVAIHNVYRQRRHHVTAGQ